MPFQKIFLDQNYIYNNIHKYDMNKDPNPFVGKKSKGT